MAEGFKLLDAYVEVTASGHGLADKVAGDIERESTGSRGLGRTGSTMGGNLLGGLKGAFTSGAVGGLVGGVVGSVTSGLTSLVAGAVSDVGSMLTTVGGMVATTVIDFNSELQNANIGFTTMLGSGKAAKGFLDDLQQFAKSTPFEFGNLVHNAQSMMGMGIAAKNVIPDLTALGDAVAAMGGSASQVDSVVLAFDQMNAKGTLDMGNMNQLMENGVPSALKVMAAAYHTTTGNMINMISTGKVQANVALPALVKGIEHGTKATAALGGMMDKQSATFTGALSNIQDGLTQTVSQAFKPFFDAASGGMQKFANALSSKPAKKFTDDLTKILKPFGKEIGDWFKHVDLNKIFSTAGKGLKDIFKGISPKDFGKALKDFGKLAGDIFNDIIRVTPKVVKAVKEVGPAIGDSAKSIVDITGSIGDMIDWFDKLDKNAHKQTKDFGDVIGSAFNAVIGWFDSLDKNARKQTKDFVDVIKTAAGGVGKWFGDTVKSFTHGWDQIVGAFTHGGKQILDFFGGLSTQLGTIAHQMIDGFIGGIQGAWGAVTSTISSLVNAIPAGVRKILGIASPSKVFHLIGTQVGQGLHLGLLGSVDQIKVTSGKLADAVREAFSGHLETTMVHRIGNIAKALERLSTARDKATARLATDRTRLADVLTARKDFAANVRSGVMGNADAASLFGTSMQAQADARQAALDANAAATGTTVGAAAGTLNGRAYQPSWTTTTAARMLAVPKVTAHAGLAAVKASLQGLLRDTKTFNANLKALTYLGIDPYSYDELVQAGVRGGGLETSAAFLADTKTARSIFSLERQVNRAGGAFGNRAAGHEYAGQVDSARRAVARDQRAVNHIEVHMVVEAKKIDEVQKLVDMVEHVKSTARKRKAKR